jgi:two-component system NtrC family sensor kinase
LSAPVVERLARIDDLLAPLTDQQIHDQEQALHEQLSRQIKDLPEVAAAWVLDADGRELVSAKVYPVDGDVPHAGREDFKALKNAGAPIFIWALRARSFEHDDYRPYFTVARRRESPDGQFRGITIVAISANYLASFFNALASDRHNYSAGILRDNGVNLARYPNTSAEPPALQQSDPLVRAIANGSSGGLIASGSLFDRDGQIIAYRRVGITPSMSRSVALQHRCCARGCSRSAATWRSAPWRYWGSSYYA